MRVNTFLALVTGVASVLAHAEIRPNFLVVLTDDIGWGDLQCYNPEGKIPTPAMDALAAAGMRFTDAHSPCAVCAPSRYAVVTGNYPWRGRTTTGAWNFRDGSDLLPGQKTFAHLLREHGYRTAIFGKTGFGSKVYRDRETKVPDWSRPLEEGPVEWGFDFSHVLLNGHQAAPYFFHRNGRMVGDPAKVMNYPRPQVYTAETDIRFGGWGLPDWDPRMVGANLLDAAEEFLDGRGGEPLLMYFNTAGAHSPYTPPGEIRGTPVRGASGLHAKADMVVEADVTFGQLIRMLEQRDLLNDTVVILTSDNGGIPDQWDYKQSYGHDPVGGLRGGKSLVWEGGHRVPFIVRWGDGTPQGSRIAPGSTSNQLVGLQDIFATVLELAGAPHPEGQGIDSISLLPELLGRLPQGGVLRDHYIASSDFRYNQALDEGEEAPAEPLVAAGVPNPGVARAIRMGAWSLIFDKDNRAVALHDLAIDLKQQRNLINDPAQAERVRAMVAAFSGEFPVDGK